MKNIKKSIPLNFYERAYENCIKEYTEKNYFLFLLLINYSVNSVVDCSFWIKEILMVEHNEALLLGETVYILHPLLELHRQ